MQRLSVRQALFLTAPRELRCSFVGISWARTISPFGLDTRPSQCLLFGVHVDAPTDARFP